MSLYFFDVYDAGLVCIDEEGSEHPDSESALDHAIRGIRSILSSAVMEGCLSLAGRVVVRDESGSGSLEVKFGDAVTLTG